MTERMKLDMDKEKLIKEFEEICGYTMRPHEFHVLNDVLVLLKEQEKEIENLKKIIKKADYTLEIAKDKLNDLLKKTEGW